MFSWWIAAVGVTVVFVPLFTPVAATLFPGKENRPFLFYKPRRPLAIEDKLSSEDSFETSLVHRVSADRVYYKTPLLCVEASISPQAFIGPKASLWTSGHMSHSHTFHVTTNFHPSAHLLQHSRVVHIKQTQASPSLWKARRYGFVLSAPLPLLHILNKLFPALAHALTIAPWASLSSSDRIDGTLFAANLTYQDPDHDGGMSSDKDDDESDDAITSYDGSAPSSPIQSFGNPLPSPAATHLDNSQFSTLAQVSTPNIIRQAQSAVFAAPSIIHDARLSAAPYSTSGMQSRSGTPSQQPSNPPTQLPSQGPLPMTAAYFGLPPPTTTPLSYISQHLVAPTPLQAIPVPSMPSDPAPFLERVSVSPPIVMPTIAGLVPNEWANFKKVVIEYNLTLDLYKPDLDWKKSHMAEPTDPANLAEYHLHTGRVNQRVGAIVLMEKVMGTYISTVGINLIQQQAKDDNLDLPLGDIEWFLTQGNKDMSKLLQDEHVPQEDIAPLLFPPPLPATPVPMLPRTLEMDTPLSTLTPLNDSPPAKIPSPSISELATPVIHSLDPTVDVQATPKAVAMDVSPSDTSLVPMLLVPTTTVPAVSVICPVTSDVVMTDAQCARIDEVLQEYWLQEEQVLKTLHVTRQ